MKGKKKEVGSKSISTIWNLWVKGKNKLSLIAANYLQDFADDEELVGAQEIITIMHFLTSRFICGA